MTILMIAKYIAKISVGVQYFQYFGERENEQKIYNFH